MPCKLFITQINRAETKLIILYIPLPSAISVVKSVPLFIYMKTLLKRGCNIWMVFFFHCSLLSSSVHGCNSYDVTPNTWTFISKSSTVPLMSRFFLHKKLNRLRLYSITNTLAKRWLYVTHFNNWFLIKSYYHPNNLISQIWTTYQVLI